MEVPQPGQEEKPKGIVQQINDLRELVEKTHIETDKKAKRFKLPFSLKAGAKQKIKQGYCFTIFVKNNLDLDFKFMPIEYGCIKLPKSNIYYTYNVKNLMRYQKYPAMIISEWNMKPYDPREDYKDAENNKTLTENQRVLINLSKLAVVGELKTKMKGKLILFIFIAAAVGFYFLAQLFGKG